MTAATLQRTQVDSSETASSNSRIITKPVSPGSRDFQALLVNIAEGQINESAIEFRPTNRSDESETRAWEDSEFRSMGRLRPTTGTTEPRLGAGRSGLRALVFWPLSFEVGVVVVGFGVRYC